MKRATPFSPAAVLGLVGIGTALFVALLWMVGSGMVHGPLNDGGAHGAGKGLTGYAALATLLEKQGWDVSFARSEAELAQPGLLVLTPPADADGKALTKIVERRRAIGPTVIVTPKWQAVPVGGAGASVPGAKTGWVSLVGAGMPRWPGFLDDVAVEIAPSRSGRWYASAAAGTLPDRRAVLAGHGASLVPLVAGEGDGRVLAAYLADDGAGGELADLAIAPPGTASADHAAARQHE